MIIRGNEKYINTCIEYYLYKVHFTGYLTKILTLVWKISCKKNVNTCMEKKLLPATGCLKKDINAYMGVTFSSYKCRHFFFKRILHISVNNFLKHLAN